MCVRMSREQLFKGIILKSLVKCMKNVALNSWCYVANHQSRVSLLTWLLQTINAVKNRAVKT